jgi:exopolysaccharide biosynthesis WecB/TagA/CpsF family protein
MKQRTDNMKENSTPRSGQSPTHSFRLFGIDVDNPGMEVALCDLKSVIESGPQTGVAFVNADCLNKCYQDGDYHVTLRGMDRVYPDGIGVRLAARMSGHEVRDNINGTDLFPLLCAHLAKTGHGMFLLGALPGVAEKTAYRMSGRYQGLNVVGARDGYFSPGDEDELIEEINASGASVVLVAMGAPRQEQWIQRHRERLDATLIVGVGGLFDFYSGRIKRAPLWIRRASLEWAWRLLQEPRRMWRRYILGNPLFLYRSWRLKRRNGIIAQALRVNPAEETRILKQFGRPPGGLDLRVHVTAGVQKLRRLVRSGGRVLKRTTDIVVSLLMLFLLAPLLLAVIIAIRMESAGPAFYSQMRVGLRGREFRLWKFRSMYLDADQRRLGLEAKNEMKGGVIFKLKQDPRVTRIGRFIRKSSIDELPQLWNVLKGDMSLVGPRPALAGEVEKYSIEERVRLLSRPGLTCFWQVSGRSDIPFDQQVRLDEDYLYRQSLMTDLKILLKTVPAVLFGKGAY